MLIRRLSLMLGLVLAAPAVWAQTTIDDFSVAHAQLQAAPTAGSAQVGGMLGGERDIRAHRFAGAGAATAEVTGGVFVFTGASATAAEARVVWDGTDGDAAVTAFTGLGGLNLTTGGADSIILDVTSASAGAVAILEVFTGASNSSLYTMWLPAVSAPTSFALPFTSFTTRLGIGATFSNVGAFSLTIRGAGATLSLDAIRAGAGAAPAITASKTATQTTDVKYTIQVDNKSGKPSSSNTALSDTLDANLTLVPGSAEASPIGREDYFFQGATTISLAAPGVLNNDTDPDGDAKSVASPGSYTTTTGATATVNANGSFSVPVNSDGTLDTFTYEVTDGNGITSPAVVTVGFVNQAPALTASGGTTAFTEDAGSVAVDTALTVTDDGGNLSSATVTISNLQDSGLETLSATASGSILVGDIVYAAPTLTITRANGPVADYQAVLRSVRYNNTSNTPNTTTRTLDFVGNDGFVNSSTTSKSVSVAAANDAPTLTAGSALAYTENDAATVIDASITVSDPDSTTLTQATVTLTTFQSGQDVLSFTNDGSTMGNVAAGTNTGGVLTLNSSGGTATLAQWQSALRAVKYTNSSDNPVTTARTVTWRVNDGAGSSNLSNQPTSTINITAVNDNPALTAGGTLSYTENAAATAIDTTITVSDVDSSTLTQATITLTTFQSGQDVLSFTNDGSTMGNIAAGTNTGGVLTLNSAGGTATLAHWQSALRAVKYSNSSDDPVTTARTVTWRINDGAGVNNLSNQPTSTINITAVNDPPTAAAVTVDALAGISVSFAAGTLSGTDSLEPGTTVTIDTTAGATSLSNLASVTLAADGSFTIVPTPGVSGTASFQYKVKDDGRPGAGVSSAVATVTVNLNGSPTLFVRSTAVGAGTCNLGAECTLATALTTISTGTGKRIFISDANNHSASPTLNSGGWIVGQGVTGTSFASVMGYTSALASLAGTTVVNGTLPSIAQAKPTVSGTITAHTNSKIAGLAITVTGTAKGLVAASRTGITVHDMGTISSVNGNAVDLTATSADFTGGGLVITASGSGAGFSAITSGTVTVQGSNNTITTSTGTALNVVNTTIGASGLTFKSITTTASSTNSGIILDTTGSSGGLTVTGDGSNTAKGGNGTGGTISNKTQTADGNSSGNGIYLNNTSNVVLRRMQLNDFENSAIRALSVTNFTLQYSTISGASGNSSAATEGAIAAGTSNPSGANGFFGTNLVDNCKISGAVEHNIEWYNQSGTGTLTVSNSDVKSNSSSFGGDGILVEMQGTAGASPDSEVVLTVDTVAFADNKSQGVQVAANDSSRVYATIKNSTLTKTTQGNEGFVLSNGSNGQLKALILSNTISGIGGAAIFVGQTPGNATTSSNLTARIANNTITHPTTATNTAVLAWFTSTVGQVSPGAVLIEGNTITQNSTGGVSRGILVDTPDANTSPAFSATVINNSVAIMDNVGGVGGIAVQGRQTANTNLCAKVAGNTVTYPNGTPGGILGLRVRQATSATVRLEAGAGSLAANNPSATTEVLGTVSSVANGTCTAVVLP